MFTLRSVGLGVAVLVSCVASSARAQSCTPPSTWRVPMVFVCADSPALASNINDNFGQVVLWLEAKVGRVGQPVALDGGVVGTFALADGAVTAPKLAANAVNTTNLVDGAVTRAKLQAGGLAVYETNSNCSGSGLTLQPTCIYSSQNCGSTCNGVTVPRYENCAGVCGSSPNQVCAPQVCTGNNTLRGYLVTP